MISKKNLFMKGEGMSLVTLKAMSELTLGNYDKVVNILEKEIDSNSVKVLSMLGLSYFYMGRYVESYSIYKNMFNNNNSIKDDFGILVMEYVENTRILELANTFPKDINKNYPQSIESADESYNETRSYKIFHTNYKNKDISDGERVNLMWDELNRRIESNDKKQSALGWYFYAETNFIIGRYEQAFQFYLKAALKEEHKALYYGYASNALLHSAKVEVLSAMCVLNCRAIDLDGKNSRWYFYQGLALKTSAITIFNNDANIMKGAKIYFEESARLLRPEQQMLKFEIDKQLADLSKWLN